MLAASGVPHYENIPWKNPKNLCVGKEKIKLEPHNIAWSQTIATGTLSQASAYQAHKRVTQIPVSNKNMHIILSSHGASQGTEVTAKGFRDSPRRGSANDLVITAVDETIAAFGPTAPALHTQQNRWNWVKDG